MLDAGLIASMRALTISTFKDAVELVDTVYVKDDESNDVPSGESVIVIEGNLQHMTSAEVSVVADKLQGRAGYKLYAASTIPVRLPEFLRINGERYEPIGVMQEGSQATYTKFLLKRIQ